MNKDEIFSLSDTNDLSEYCKKQLKQLKRIAIKDDVINLFDLFKIKNRLSVDEVIVAFYRLYEIEKTRSWFSATLSNLSKRGLIKKINGTEGKYEKCEK